VRIRAEGAAAVRGTRGNSVTLIAGAFGDFVKSEDHLKPGACLRRSRD